MDVADTDPKLRILNAGSDIPASTEGWFRLASMSSHLAAAEPTAPNTVTAPTEGDMVRYTRRRFARSRTDN